MNSGDPQRKWCSLKWLSALLFLIILTINWFYLDSTVLKSSNFVPGWDEASDCPVIDAQTDQAIEWLMRERRQTLRQNCFIYGNSVSYKEVPRFIAIKEIETLYLPVPKVGCTNWKKIIMMIED